MLTATGKKRQALEISRNGEPITVLDQQKGAFTLNGQSYKIRRAGWLTLSMELRRGDEMLAFTKGAPFVNRTTVTLGDKSWQLKAENFRATHFGLYDGATRLGGITPAGGWRPWNGATIDLPDALPLDVQVFLTSIVVSKWIEGSSPP
jgi:hypothetical protein